ncbi:MAG: sulfatase-like hydrolase/transferase [Rikenellaceae bacterium]
MNRLKLCALLGVVVTPAVAKTASASTEERPNILFILSDDHAKPAISAYGGRFAEIAPTPNIDQIAQNGTLFNHMICTNSISGPSRACLITGKYGTTNGFYQNEGKITFDNTQQTTPRIFQANGYNTALFGKWHLYSTPVGFDHYMVHADPSQQGRYWNPLYDIDGVKREIEGYCTNITTDAALDWFENDRDESKPFCMMLHYKSPHRPCIPDSLYQHLFEDVELPYPETFDDDYSTRETTLGANMATVENHFSREDIKMTPPSGIQQKGGAEVESIWRIGRQPILDSRRSDEQGGGQKVEVSTILQRLSTLRSICR